MNEGGVDIGTLPVNEQKPLLNLELGKKIRKDLQTALVEGFQKPETEVTQKLDTAVAFTQLLIDKIIEDPDRARGLCWSRDIDKFGKMTGEEKALAAHYFFVELDTQAKDTIIGDLESRSYQVYQANESQAIDKSISAPLSNHGHWGYDNKIEPITVGTTQERAYLIKTAIKAIVKGPAQVDASFSWKVDDYVTSHYGQKIPTGRSFTESTTFPDRSLQNYLGSDPQLNEQAVNVMQGIKSLITTP